MSPLIFSTFIVVASMIIIISVDQWVKRWYEDKEESNA